MKLKEKEIREAIVWHKAQAIAWCGGGYPTNSRHHNLAVYLMEQYLAAKERVKSALTKGVKREGGHKRIKSC